ncbi:MULTISPECIES: flavodoxin [unclassified Fusibacter]|uniref:flavodoxin family protein n=1 Tax=unclassified Fusibacter TaxID=2624464 RepID=UPI0010105C33|nr:MULTISPECIES: flavodoxin family protein [unclassified Fusibacter]MCK8059799.1 flavodoxin family protein [Fusibacter sp. A2]NPE21600.1 flavodoxin family protein [Fusibacter sp. A1]RXV62007.1 hypothetical protein DWB64_07140 [Fusibacter sp. A1]
MSDTLIVFYSLEGNCKGISEHLSKKFNFDTLALKPIHDLDPNSMSKHIKGRIQVLLNQQVVLEQSDIDLSKYKTVIIGSPVWMGTFASAIQTFLDLATWTDQQIALFATFDKDCGHIFEKFGDALEGFKIIGQEAFDIEKQNEDEIFTRAELWVRSMFDL